MANRFPLIANSSDSKIYELPSADNLDLSGCGIYNGTATITLPTVTSTLATLAGTETLTNKTINLTNNTLVATSAQLASAITDETGSGSLVFSASPTFTGTANFANISASGDITVTGNLTINGTTTNINTTNLVVEDKNIILGDVTTPSNTTADGGGITLKGATDKTLNWVNATGAWTSSEDFNLLTGKVYEINGTSVLSATTLGSGVTGSSLTSVGTIGTGTWQGTAVGVAYGGTGQTTYTNGQLLIGNTTGNTLTKATLTGTSNQITVTNGAGSITLSTPQSIATTSSVQFGSFGVGTAASGTTGEIRATNSITSYYSDERLKKDITEISGALNKVMQLKGVTFRANELAESYGYTSDKEQVGVIAQDVEKVLPQIVVPAPFDRIQIQEGVEISRSGENYKTVHYEKLVPLLIQAIKEQQVMIEELKKKVGI